MCMIARSRRRRWPLPAAQSPWRSLAAQYQGRSTDVEESAALQVLQPEVRMLMMRKEEVGEGGLCEYRYHELPLMHIGGGARLWLVSAAARHRRAAHEKSGGGDGVRCVVRCLGWPGCSSPIARCG